MSAEDKDLPPQLAAPALPNDKRPTSVAQALDWEHPESGKAGRGTTKGRLAGRAGFAPLGFVVAKFDALVPPHRTYFGRSRRTAVLIVGTGFLVLLVLAIGLGVGLGGRSKAQDLPLPGNTDHFTGDLTYYGTGLGACGITSNDSEDIVAVSHLVFDAAQTGSNPNQNPLCGKKVRATRFDEQVGQERSVDLTVVDRCVGCKATDLDTSPTAFQKLADIDKGRVNVTWAWL